MTSHTELIDAIRAGNNCRIRELVTADPTVAAARDEGGVSALLTALYFHQEQAAKLLHEQLTELDVFEASALDDVARLEALLHQDEAAFQVKAGDGFTPLHLASYFGQLEATRTLLAGGAQPNAVAENPTRVQPLHSAMPGGHLEICELLLQAGAVVNTAQAGGWTPLMAAARRGSVPIVERLLRAGADVSMAADNGQTARDLATIEVLQVLP